MRVALWDRTSKNGNEYKYARLDIPQPQKQAEPTPPVVEESKPDAVVVATGAAPVLPDIPGINGEKVVNAWDLLQDKVHLASGRTLFV